MCKSKKLAFQRAVENAFSRVILIVLSNGKVSVEIDTTKPEVRLADQIRLLEEPVIKVNITIKYFFFVYEKSLIYFP